MKHNHKSSKKKNKFTFLKNKKIIKDSKYEIERSIINLGINQMILSGKHPVISALQNRQRKVFYLISTQDHYMTWENNIKNLGLKIEIKIKTKEQLDIINNVKPHQNVILIVEPLKRISLDEF